MFFCRSARLCKIYRFEFHETWWRGEAWAENEMSLISKKQPKQAVSFFVSGSTWRLELWCWQHGDKSGRKSIGGFVVMGTLILRLEWTHGMLLSSFHWFTHSIDSLTPMRKQKDPEKSLFEAGFNGVKMEFWARPRRINVFSYTLVYCYFCFQLLFNLSQK